jgi:hypothetical protein
MSEARFSLAKDDYTGSRVDYLRDELRDVRAPDPWRDHKLLSTGRADPATRVV